MVKILACISRGMNSCLSRVAKGALEGWRRLLGNRLVLGKGELEEIGWRRVLQAVKNPGVNIVKSSI